MTLDDLIAFHRSTAALEPRAEAHNAHHVAAAELLESMRPGAVAPEPGIAIRLDVALGPHGPIGEGALRLRLPVCPVPGEAIVIDGQPYVVGARMFEVLNGELTVGLLVQKTGGSIVAAPASALGLNGRKLS